jgi:signal transduction histidine kinase
VDVRAEKQDQQLILTIIDTGMGISEKNLPFVFDRFWQADTSSKRKFHGAGIGLALVKELVELQNGAVTVASQEGKGTTFKVMLPFLDGQSAEKVISAPEDVPVPVSLAGPSPSEEWLANLYRRAELFPSVSSVQSAVRPVEAWTDGGRPRVLVADDEPDMLRFLKSQLSAHFQVLEAVDGQQAIDKASQFLPDLVLLDMMMPDKDGLQACRELRERTPTQSIPIILLTARADEETKLAALNAGASDFLSKPFSTTELHVRIKNLIESHEYQQKVAKQNQVLSKTIEQLKETESELVQSEKMRSLGQLSAGMVHEILNPLTFTTTALSILRGKAKWLADEQRAEYVEMIEDVEDGVKRVQSLAGIMRDFSYADSGQTEAVDLSKVAGDALRFLRSQCTDGNVDVVQEIAGGERISANTNRMIQVLLNLLQNSIDALGRKTFQGAERPTIWISSGSEAGRTTLTIRDNGPGIAPEHLDKIFDPFFTTKDVGEGMGLGLSICYRIVQDYGGRICVRSEPGEFCEFRLEFPIERLSFETAGAVEGDQYAGTV